MSAAITFQTAFERLSPSSSQSSWGLPMKTVSALSLVCRFAVLGPR